MWTVQATETPFLTSCLLLMAVSLSCLALPSLLSLRARDQTRGPGTPECCRQHRRENLHHSAR